MKLPTLARLALLTSMLAMVVSPARAWWDTQIQVVRQVPTVKEFQAEALPGIPADIVVDDAKAMGGKAVLLKPGGATLVFEEKLAASHYAMHLVLMGDDIKDGAEARKRPVLLAMKVSGPGKDEVRTYRQRVAYMSDRYEDGAHLYFPIYVAGTVKIEITSSKASTTDLRIDFAALKDVFGDLPKVGEKKGQYLMTKQELAVLRDQPKSVKRASALLREQVKLGVLGDPAAMKEWQAKTFRDIWDANPPRNLHFAVGLNKGGWGVVSTLKKKAKEDKAGSPPIWTLGRGWGPWTFTHPVSKKTYGLAEFESGETMGDCILPDDLTSFHTSTADAKGIPAGFTYNWAAQALMTQFKNRQRFIKTRAADYLRTGDEVAGWQGLCALIAYADLYPDIDYQTQQFSFGSKQFGMNPLGKFVYSGWAWGPAQNLVEAYDHLFPVIQKNKHLASIAKERIPGIRNNNDIIKLLDTNILQHVRDCVDRQVIRAGEGDSEKVAVLAGLVQGPGKAGAWIMQLPFTRCHMRMMNRGGLQDHFISSTNTDGSGLIGSIEYAKARSALVAEILEYVERYKALGGKLPVDLTDRAAFPSIWNGPAFGLDRVVAGAFVPRIGDWGTAADPRVPLDKAATFRSLYAIGFRDTAEPRYAWWLQHWGRRLESDEEWLAITEAARSVKGDGFQENRSRLMPGMGMSVLEAGFGLPAARRSAAVLRAGIGQGHGHCDQLSLLIYGQGVRAQVNNGRRGGRNNSRQSRWHNSLEVDETNFMPKKSGSSGVGWLETMNDLGDDLGYTRGRARSPSHPQLKVYRRDVAMIPVGDGDAFIFDVFRAEGGKVHTWCNAGPVSPIGGIAVNTQMTKSALPDDLPTALKALEKEGKPSDRTAMAGYQYVDTYLGGWNERQQGKAGETTIFTWDVKGYAQKRYKVAPDAATQVRSWRLGTKGQTVMTAYGQFSDYAIKNAPGRNFTYTRNETAAGELSEAYPTVTEVYPKDKPMLASVKQLKVRGATGAMAAVAVEVVSPSGEKTVAMMSGSGEGKVVAGAVSATAEFASVTMKDRTVTRIGMVGGTDLVAAGFSIKTDTARYSATVTGLKVAENAVVVDAEFPAALNGANFLVARPRMDHNTSYIVNDIKSADGSSSLVLRGGLKTYESTVTHFEDATGDVVMDLPFVLSESDDTYYDNMPVLNEKGEVLGGAELRKGDRFMFMHKPWHQKWRQTFDKYEAIPDADGDGKRTLRMIATTDIRRLLPTELLVKKGETMGVLEVTRVAADGSMIWFKDIPEVYSDSAGVPHRHWPYQDMQLITEDGKRVLQANYPGDEVNLAAKGRMLTKADLTDENGDGRITAALSAVAVGDTLSTPSSVSLTLKGKGVYRLRASCGVTLTTPARRNVLVGIRHGERIDVAAPRVSRNGTFTLSLEEIAGREVYIILPEKGSYSLPVGE